MSNSEQLTIEKFKQALEGIKSLAIEPYKCFYCNVETHRLSIELASKTEYREFNLAGAINLIVDKDIEAGHVIYCEPGIYEYWKTLKASQFIDQNDKTINLWKIADTLFRADKENREIKISWKDPIWSIK